jgi:hypothetical protein
VARRTLTPVLLVAALCALAAFLWRQRPSVEVGPETEGESAPLVPAPPPLVARGATPSLAGRGRRVILPTGSRRRHADRADVPPASPAPPRPVAEVAEDPLVLPVLQPNDLGRVVVRVTAPDGQELPATAEVARGVLATGLEWEGTVRIRHSETRVAGNLVVEGVPEGEQQIVVEVGDWAPEVLSVHARRGYETHAGHVFLSTGHEIAGVVVDAEARPVARALVRGAGRRFTTHTDDRGGFTISRLPTGPVDLEAEADGFLAAEIEVEAGRDRTVRIVLERAALLKGTLLLPDGSPAAFLRLVLVDVGAASRERLEPFPFRTDEDGSFEIEAVPGRYRVESGQAPLGVSLAEPTLVGGETHHLELRVPPER